MARYSVLRLLIFFGFLCALWLLGLQDESERWLLLGGSALGSMVASYFVLRGPRDEFSASVARQVDERVRRAEQTRARQLIQDTKDSKDSKDTKDTDDAEGTEGTEDVERP